MLSPRRVAINYMCTGRWRVFSIFVTRLRNICKITLVCLPVKKSMFLQSAESRPSDCSMCSIRHPLAFPRLLWERLLTHISITVYSQVLGGCPFNGPVRVMKYPTRESQRRDAASPIKYNGLRVPQPSSFSHCAQPAVPYRNIMD